MLQTFNTQHLKYVKLSLTLHLQLLSFYEQTIEDSTKRNVVRSVTDHTLFKGDDLQDLYIVFKVKIGCLRIEYL